MIAIYIESSDELTYNRIRYVITQLFLPIGFPFTIARDVRETYGRFLIVCVPIAQAEHYTSNSRFDLIIPYSDYELWACEDVDIKMEVVERIPILYIGQPPQFLIHERQVGFDLINLTFFLLTRQEEYTYQHRDLWDCFAASYSVLYEHGVLWIPIINCYIRFIEEYIRESVREPPEPKWKNDAPYAVILSHDVDSLPTKDVTVSFHQMLRNSHMSGFVSKLGHLKSCVMEMISCISPIRPTWQLSNWLEKEDEYGFRSTFFLASNTPSRHPSDPTYWLHSKLLYNGRKQHLSEVAKSLEDAGWEVGLHGSYNTFQDEDLLRREKDQLVMQTGRDVVGIRQHYLRFDVRKTWRIHEKLGFAYDSTLGYNERNGFRAGIAFPFTPYDMQNKQEYDLTELPMAIMDGNFFADHGEKLDAKKALKRCRKLFDVIERTEGLLCINFHPHYHAIIHPDWWAVYEYILRRAAESSAWVATGREVTEWWTDRRRRLIQHV